MKTILTAIVATLALVSCVPSTPQARIQQSPQLFERLSDKEKSLVERGQISRGMSPDAVYLAWGSPSSTMMGSYKGKDSERWDYTGSMPVYTTNFYGGYGYGGYYGHHGHHHGYNYSGFGFGPQVSYLPTHIASVWFVSQRVDAWERLR